MRIQKNHLQMIYHLKLGSTHPMQFWKAPNRPQKLMSNFWPFHCFVNVLPIIRLICFSTKHCSPDYTSYSTLIQIRQAISKKLKSTPTDLFCTVGFIFSHAHPWRGERKLNFIHEAVYNNVYVHSVLLGCNLLLILITLGTRE